LVGTLSDLGMLEHVGGMRLENNLPPERRNHLELYRTGSEFLESGDWTLS
jgi:hypothetical protein